MTPCASLIACRCLLEANTAVEYLKLSAFRKSNIIAAERTRVATAGDQPERSIDSILSRFHTEAVQCIHT